MSLTAGAYAEDVPDSLSSLQLHAIQAPPDADQTLTSVTSLPLEQVADGHWLLPAGVYRGNYVVDVSITLECAEGALFDGGGQKNAINVRASAATLKNCRVENWGNNLTDMNAAVFVERTAQHAVL